MRDDSEVYIGMDTSKLKISVALAAAGRDGEVRTLCSCRHTYIINALSMGLSTHLVAVNCGTSTAMIDRFYSKLTASMNASPLSG